MIKRLALGALAFAAVVAGCSSGGSSVSPLGLGIGSSLPVNVSAAVSGQVIQVTASPNGITPASIVAIGIDTITGQNNNVQLQQNGGVWTGLLPNVISQAGDPFRVDVTAYGADGTTLGSGSFSGISGATSGTTGTATGTTTAATTGPPGPPVFTGTTTTGSGTASTTGTGTASTTGTGTASTTGTGTASTTGTGTASTTGTGTASTTGTGSAGTTGPPPPPFS